MAAAVGVLQNDSAPNITGNWDIRRLQGYNIAIATGGAFSFADIGGSYYPGTQAANQNVSAQRLSFSAKNSNSVYGRRNEIAPKNYAVQFFIKY